MGSKTYTSSSTSNSSVYQTTSNSNTTNINPALQDSEGSLMATSGSVIDTSLFGNNTGTINITDGNTVAKVLELTGKALDNASTASNKITELLSKAAAPDDAAQKKYSGLLMLAAAGVIVVLIVKGFK